MPYRSHPSPLLRAVLGAPRFIYRIGLGRLLGHRFLELTYGGRTSRKVRRVLLEVARYDAAQRESVVVAAWGDRTEWYRNLLAEPALMAETGAPLPADPTRPVASGDV